MIFHTKLELLQKDPSHTRAHITIRQFTVVLLIFFYLNPIPPGGWGSGGF